MRLSQLYEADETAWLEKMSELLKQRRFDKLDVKHLSEYLQDMAIRDRREVLSRLVQLFIHLLKWDFHPRKRSRSWKLSILNQQNELQDILSSQTLRNHALEVIPKAYARARRLAAVETGMREDRFPAECPYTLENAVENGDDELPNGEK